MIACPPTHPPLMRRHPMLLLTLIALLPATRGAAQQVADSAFNPPIVAPNFAPGAGPHVAIDAAHVNFHTMDGSFQSFAKLLQRDGYRVTSNSAPFTEQALAGIGILVIANAMHPQSEADFAPLPNLSAFTDAEIGVVQRWVEHGGALLLIADHMPIAGHTESLAAAFGIRFYNGFAFGAGREGRMTFRRSDGSLGRSAELEGAQGEGAEQVDSVTSFTGQAFRVDPQVQAERLLILPEHTTLLLPTVAWQFSDSTPRVSAAYLLQGALVRHGRGRVAVFGEAAMFSAQLAGPRQNPMGMNHPAAGQNHLFVLNVLRWLSADRR